MTAHVSTYNANSLFNPMLTEIVREAKERALFLGDEMLSMHEPKVRNSRFNIRKSRWTNLDPTIITAANSSDLPVVTPTYSSTSHVCETLGLRGILADGTDDVRPKEILDEFIDALSNEFDERAISVMAAGFANTSATLGVDTPSLSVDRLHGNTGALRARRVTGPYVALISTIAGTALLQDIGTDNYASSPWQTQATEMAALKTIGGCMVYQSSLLDTINSGNTAGFIYKRTTFKIGLYRNVFPEVQRRAEAIGRDVVGSIIGVAAVADSNRGIEMVDF